MSVWEQAHTLTDLGYHVVPLEQGGKKPILRGWQRIRSTHDLIEQWCKKCPDANLGIHTGFSGIAVADCDSVEACEWVKENLPASPMIQHSPRGGLHVFYADDGAHRPRVNVFSIHLDIRAGLSQIVAFPSRSQRGSWRLHGLVSPSHLPILPMIEAVRHSVREQTVSVPDMNRVFRYVDRCEPAVNGSNGHGVTFRVACSLLRAFPWLSMDQLRAAMEIYSQKCLPPWSEKEIEHKCQDAWDEVRG